jgi:hypothetical protein
MPGLLQSPASEVFLMLDQVSGLAGLLGYVGPGAGLSMVGALVAVVLVILLALIGPILYPIRLIHSFIRRRRERIAMCNGATSSHAPQSPLASPTAPCGGSHTAQNK